MWQDGCAIDFETSANGVRVEGNTIYKSWGAGIMVFGHATTSHNLSISNNSFIEAGCIQTRGDRAAIAFTCPNHQKASGFLNHNLARPPQTPIFASSSARLNSHATLSLC